MVTDIANAIAQLKGESKAALLRSKRDYPLEDCLELIQTIGERLVDGFILDDKNTFVYTNLALWCINSPQARAHLPENHSQSIPADCRKGIYIAGNTGTGKSICLDVMNEFCDVLGLKTKFVDEVNFLSWKTFRTDKVCDYVAETGDIARFKDMPVVCFQDLGCEPSETMYMGNRHNVMREILEHRGDDTGIVTLISSNIPIHKTATLYGPRVQSRLRQMCNYYVLGGADRRK